MVRIGIGLAGLSPAPHRIDAASLGLRPAMTLRARVALVKRITAGTGVSYGHRFVTEKDTTIALVPVGYGDGIPRNATNRGQVLLGGVRRRIAGTVCMDQFVVDVGDDDVAIGDEVVIFGPGEVGEPTADEWADVTDTISWEIVTRLGPRLPRTYRHG
jgi:alanine racemase